MSEPTVPSLPVAPQRRVFRDRAVERYLRAEQEAVLPPSTRSRTFVILWLLAIVLLLAATMVASRLVDRLLSTDPRTPTASAVRLDAVPPAVVRPPGATAGEPLRC